MHLRRSLAVAAACSAAAVQQATAQPWQPQGESANSGVSCGGHFASTCEQCVGSSGSTWCNGQCLWLSDKCILPGPMDYVEWFLWGSFTHWWRLLPWSIFVGVLMLAYACVYKVKIVDQLPKRIPHNPIDFDDWEDREVGLFACLLKPDQCCWAAFCTPVVAAKNYHVGNVMGYWSACFFVWLGMWTFFFPFYCVMVIVRTAMSAKLKRNLRFKTNYAADLCVTLCCFPCEVGRESIEVNEAIGKTIECPFEVY